MKKRSVLFTSFLSVLLTMSLLIMNAGVFHAEPDNQAKNDLYSQGIGVNIAYHGEEAAYQYIVQCNGAVPASVI